MDKRFKYIVDFVAQTREFQKEIGGMAGTLKSVGVAAAAYFSTDAILSFGKASLDAYNSSIQSETALLTALKGRSDVQENLIDQATELMGKTLYDDDDIVRAQSLVAAFVKEENQIKTLIPLIQDMATAKQMDLAGAADLVTKTFAGEMNALGRYGIQVKGAAGSSERLLSIQRGLNDAFGGQAEEAAKVGTASLVQLDHEWGNVEESIGRLIIAQENQAGSFTKVMAQNTRAVAGFLGTIAEYNEAGSDTTNSVLTALMVRAGFISQKAVDTRIFLNKAAQELKSEMDASVESFAPVNINANQFTTLDTLSEKLQKLNDDLKQIDITDKVAIEAQKAKIKATEDQIKSITGVSDATKYQVGTVGSLNEQISVLNEKLAKTNASDIKSIQIIGEKIQALEKQKKAIESIASDPASFRTDKFDLLDTQRLTSQAAYWGNRKLTIKVSNDDKAFNMKPKLDIKDFQGDSERLKEALKQIQDEEERTRQKTEAIRDAFYDGFSSIGQSVVDGLGLAEHGFEGFISGLADTAIKLISMMLAQAMANSIMGATAAGAATGPLSIFTTPAFIATAIAGVLGAFAAIPEFASGGIVSGRTTAIVGEYPGAKSNPEVIAPLSKLKGMIGNNGGSTTVILQPGIDFSMDKFRFFLKRIDSKTSKRTGK